MRTLCGTIFAALLVTLSAHGAFDVRDFGAKGDGVAREKRGVEEDIGYLKRKWRDGVVDKSTGLGTDGVLDGWKKIVAARGEEPWEVTKERVGTHPTQRAFFRVSRDFSPLNDLGIE